MRTAWHAGPRNGRCGRSADRFADRRRYPRYQLRATDDILTETVSPRVFFRSLWIIVRERFFSRR
jgi:hypothetical protein